MLFQVVSSSLRKVEMRRSNFIKFVLLSIVHREGSEMLIKYFLSIFLLTFIVTELKADVYDDKVVFNVSRSDG